MKWVGADGVAQFVEVSGRADSGQLRDGQREAAVEINSVLRRKFVLGGAEPFERMDVVGP